MPAHAKPWDIELGLLDRVAESLTKAVATHATGDCPCFLCNAHVAVGTAAVMIEAVQAGMVCDWREPAPEPPPAKPKGKAPPPKPPAKGAGPYGSEGDRR
jgi:hypothetical protein